LAFFSPSLKESQDGIVREPEASSATSKTALPDLLDSRTETTSPGRTW